MTNENQESIGKRLKTWRRSLGMNQIEFSKLSNLGLAILRKCEIDASMPGGHTLISLANTGVNIHWLLTGNGSMTTPEQENVRPYIHQLIALGEDMATLSNEACDDILTEMSLRIKTHLHLQKIDKALEIHRKKLQKD